MDGYLASFGPSGGTFGAAGAGVANFKGIMLCNRPGVSDSASQKPSSVGFKTLGNVPETIHPTGRNVELAEIMDKIQQVPKKESVVSKVKKELEALAAKKRELQAAKEEEESAAAERRERIAESQRKVREAIRSQAIVVDGEPGGDENVQPAGVSAYSHLPAKGSTSAQGQGQASGMMSGAGGKGGKPAWARSTQTQDKIDEDEEEDLLGFVGSFNPDSYERGLEEGARKALLSTQLAEVEEAEALGQARLARLQAAAAASDGEGEGDGLALEGESAAQRKLRRRRRKQQQKGEAGGSNDSDNEGEGDGSGDEEEDAGSTVSSVGPLPTERKGGKKRQQQTSSGDEGGARGGGGAGGDGTGGGGDAGSIATSILSSASQLRAVHSKKSMTTLVERTQASERERIAEALRAGDTTAASAVALPVIPTPLVAEHNELRGALEGVRNLVSNLPYQHRNPVI